MIRWEGSRLVDRETWACLVVLFLVTVAPVALSADGGADPSNRVTFHVTANYPLEAREDVGYAGGFDILAGADFPIWRAMDLYAGPRIGGDSETVCTGNPAPQRAPRPTPS